MMLKLVFVLMWILIVFWGCSNGTTRKVNVIITGYEYESGRWQGCIGTDWKTCIKTLDGHIDYVCGKFGAKGDTISGWWTEGHWDGALNGFSRKN